MKKFFALVLTVTLLFSMVACSNGEKEAVDNPPPVNPVALSIEISIGQDDAKEDFQGIVQTDFTAEEGSTILEATQLFCMANDMTISVDDAQGYVTEIGGLTEKDYTETTGWIFTVNGEMPSVGADEITIKENDKILWEFVDFSTYSW